MRRLVYLLVGCCLLSSPLFAQSTVPQGAAFKLVADVDPVDVAKTTTYRLYRAGVVVDSKPVTAVVAGVITFDVAGTLAPGAYSYELSAFGAGGEAKSAPPLVVTVTAVAPGAPKNFRLVLAVVTASDGTETLTFRLVPE